MNPTTPPPSNVDKVTQKKEVTEETPTFVDASKPSKEPEETVITEPVTDKTKETESVKDPSPEFKKAETNYSFNARTISPILLNIGHESSNLDAVSLPSDSNKILQDVAEQTPKIEVTAANIERWVEVVKTGADLNALEGYMKERLNDDNSDFVNEVEQDGIELNGYMPKFKQTDNQTLSGDRAILSFINHLGSGSLFKTPLWHSGLWITFKPPTDAELVEFNRLISNDKIELGRHSFGLIFNNSISYTNDRIVDFAINHIYSMSGKGDVTIASLKEYIDCKDIPILIWGFLCTMYPTGFKYSRGCISNPEKCNYVLNDTLNIRKIMFTDLNSLTERQRLYMCERQSNQKDSTDLKRYVDEFKLSVGRVVDIEENGKKISINLKNPSVKEYIDSGYIWISDIVTSVEEAMGSDVSDVEKNRQIDLHGKASSMRQYRHWIKSIEFDDNIIEDSNTIDRLISDLSSSDNIRDKFMEEVRKYINDSTISMVGIPVYACPKCGIDQEDKNIKKEFANIIPMDLVQIFFHLLAHRLRKMIQR